MKALTRFAAYNDCFEILRASADGEDASPMSSATVQREPIRSNTSHRAFAPVSLPCSSQEASPKGPAKSSGQVHFLLTRCSRRIDRALASMRAPE